VAFVHLAVVWSFAVAQPLLDLLGDNPEFFVARENTRGDILILAFVLVLVPPLVLTGVEALASLVSERLRQAIHVVLIGVLASVFALQLFKDWFDGTAALLLPMAIAVGVGVAVAYARTRAMPTVLTVLGPAPLIFLAIFLLGSPVSKLVLPGGEVEGADVAVPGDAPVVMIVLDEFSGLGLMGPGHRIDASAYPNFARLAATSTWYRNATTVADFTGQAVPALVTGNRPDPGAIPTAADHPESLFTLLGGKFSFDVTEPVTDVCPQRFCPIEATGRPPTRTRLKGLFTDLSLVVMHQVAPRDLESELDPVDRSFGDFGQSTPPKDPASPAASAQGAEAGFQALAALAGRTEEFERFNRGLQRAAPSRSLSFLHVQLPHNPYNFLPTGQRYFEAPDHQPGLGADNTWESEPLARLGFARFRLQIGYADRLLGQTLDSLRRSGIYDKAMIVVVADHGISFRPGAPYRNVTPENLAQVADVPLLIKLPGQRKGRIVDDNVRTIDVLPTIAKQLGVKLPWRLDGRPVDEATSGGEVRLSALRRGDFSLPFTEYVRRRDALADRFLRESNSPGSHGLYPGGPEGQLIGRQADQLEDAPVAGAGVQLDASGMYVSVDPNGEVVPSLVTGQATGIRPGDHVAVAVNGRVAGTADAYADGDVVRFAAIVSPDAYSVGTNALDVYRVTAGGRLARLGGLGGAYRLARRHGAKAVRAPSGRWLRVAEGRGGVVQTLGVSGENEVTLDGWAGLTEPATAAPTVIAFAGSHFLGETSPSLERSDLKKAYGPELAQAGFKLSGFAPGPPPGSPGVPITAYAVVGGAAYPLELRTP
jgi:sulfatase-like protein